MKLVPFSIFRRSIPRSNWKSKSVYYTRFFDELGHIVRTKALGAMSKKNTALEARALLDREGLASANPFVLDFLAVFWKLDSPYVRMKALRGSPQSVNYVTVSASIIRM